MMPTYDVFCDVCGPGELVMSMSDVTGTWVCPVCHGPAARRYTAPYDHSENTFHPFYSDALSPTADKVFVASRADERAQMMRMGMGKYEKGMIADNKKAWAEFKENQTKETVGRVKDETVRKLYFAKNYGYAPTR